VAKRNSVPSSVLRAFTSQNEGAKQLQPRQQQLQQHKEDFEFDAARVDEQQQLWELLADGVEDEYSSREEATGQSPAAAATARGVAEAAGAGGAAVQSHKRLQQQQQQQLNRYGRGTAVSQKLNSRSSSGTTAVVAGRAAGQEDRHGQPAAAPATRAGTNGRGWAASASGALHQQQQQQEEKEVEEREQTEEKQQQQERPAWSHAEGRDVLSRGQAGGLRASPYKQRLGAATQKAVALLREQQARRQQRGGAKGVGKHGAEGGGYGDVAQLKAHQRLQQRVREQQERLRQQILAEAVQGHEEEEQGNVGDAAAASQQQEMQRVVEEEQEGEMQQGREVSARDIWGGSMVGCEEQEEEEEMLVGGLSAAPYRNHQQHQQWSHHQKVASGCMEMSEEEVYGQRSPAGVPTPASQRFRTCAAAAVVGARESAYA
jgi:hypothetical protein